MTSKIQFLKAIHNGQLPHNTRRDVVYDVKDTIFESNSQLLLTSNNLENGCL